MFGYTVEERDTFLRRLERSLNASLSSSAPVRIECLNLGAGGYGPVAEAYVLEHSGMAFDPDMIVLSLFVGNDIDDARREIRQLESRLFARPKPGFGFLLRRFLGERSHIYALIGKRLHGLLVRTHLHAIDPSTVDALRVVDSPETARGWDILENQVLAMRSMAAKAKADFVVVVIPLRHQVNVEEWHSITRAYRLREPEFDLELPNRRLAAFLQQSNIPCLDLLPDFRASRIDLYNSGADAHLNADGHAFVAQALHAHVLPSIAAETRH